MSKIFTGLVEEKGKIGKIKNSGNFMQLEILAKSVQNKSEIGDSIAINGVCLTVIKINDNGFTSDVMPETFNRTNLKRLKTGSEVNLEKSLTLSKPLGGHLVTGDVDCEGEIKQKYNEGNAIIYSIDIPEKYMRYIVEKGRITIDGASLTIVNFEKNRFKVSLIPHTQANITLGDKNIGDTVNIETDLIGKYVERILSQSTKNKNIDSKFLSENGFM